MSDENIDRWMGKIETLIVEVRSDLQEHTKAIKEQNGNYKDMMIAVSEIKKQCSLRIDSCHDRIKHIQDSIDNHKFVHKEISSRSLKWQLAFVTSALTLCTAIALWAVAEYLV